MIKKPANLIYGLEDKPGWVTSYLLGIQHIFLMSIAFVFPVVIVESIGGTPEQAESLITIAMLMTGLATMLQAVNRGPVGSGYLCPLLNGPAFLSASLTAGQIGGLPLIFGMTAVGGIAEGLFSRVVPKLRAIFPPEVIGTIVLMVGIEVIPLAIPRYCGMDSLHHAPDILAIILGSITLAAMVGLNIWGKGKIRLFSVILGMLIGYGIAFLIGRLTVADLHHFTQSSIFRLPRFGQYGMAFHPALLVPFLVATLSSALKTMGDLTTCQKTNDMNWKRSDLKSISGGILAGAIGNVLSGLGGGLGQSVSSSNVGLSIATGATSRRIGYTTGTILILMAFFPKLAAVFVIMPTPVMGASLVFAASFMIVAGIQIISSRMLDTRKILVVGISLVFGLSHGFAPSLFKDVHYGFAPFFTSGLSITTLCAVILNLLFRIGISKTVEVELVPGRHTSDDIFKLVETQGAAWGALPQVMRYRVGAVINEFLETITRQNLALGPIRIHLAFDEFKIIIDIRFLGDPIVFTETLPAESLDTLPSQDELSGYLIQKHVDKIKVTVHEGIRHYHLQIDQ